MTVGGDSPGPGLRRYKMHGVSHLQVRMMIVMIMMMMMMMQPDDTDTRAPPPTHNLTSLITQHPLAYQSRHASMESIGYNLTRSPGGGQQEVKRSPGGHQPGRALSRGSSLLQLPPARPTVSPPQPPRQPPAPSKQLSASSASSMIDLSQAQIRLSPLERTTSHISLNMHGPRTSPDTAAEAAARRGSAASSQLTSQLSRNQSQLQLARSSPASQLTSAGSRPKMTRSQSHLSSVRRPASGGGQGDPLQLGGAEAGGSEHLDRFLASVERINAETEARLSEDTDQDTSAAPSRREQPRPGSGGVNLRRGRTISSRWHSMESLDSTSTRQPRPGPQHTQHGVRVEVHREAGPRPRSRDSFGPRGFTSMVSLAGAGAGAELPRATSSPVQGPPLPLRNRRESGGRRAVARAESSPLYTAASDCSCDTEATEAPQHRDEAVPRPVMAESKKTKIEYLGSVPIDHKATDLSNLQIPMKNLYFKSIEMKNLGHQQLPGTMEVSETGLKVNYIRELHKGVQEIFNPFPTIAVWAAVKFVVKAEPGEGARFAFLPLIADPEDGGKTQLFYPLSGGEAELARSLSPHPALFAAVMRKAGVAKQLECHGFVCDSPEEAIMVAANLYQALLETMKRNKRAASQSQVRRT